MTDAQTLEDEKTRDELYERAQELDIEGRSEMDKPELAAAVAAAEGSDDGSGGAQIPGPNRPAQGATNPKVAGPPPVADQPGLGRPANPDPVPGPTPNLGVDRVGAEVTRAKERARQAREAAAAQG